MTDPSPDDLHPQVPDTVALRHRVLLTGALTLALLLAYTYVLTAVGADDVWALPGMVVVYVLVVRPLMRPVRAAVRLRRRLAYRAFLDSRDDRG